MNKQELIEKYWDINVCNNDWWSPIEDSFQADMHKIGIDVDRIYFDIDYDAWFEGRVADWRLFLKALGYDNEVLINLACEYWSCSVNKSSWYRNGVSFDFDLPNPINDGREIFVRHYSLYNEDDLRNAAWLAVLETFNYEEIKDKIKNAINNYMSDLLHALRKEYDYLTSAEAIWKTIVACGLDKECEDVE